MSSLLAWGKRIGAAAAVAVALSAVNLPVPAITAAAPQFTGTERLLIDQPDPPQITAAPPALPAGAPLKKIPAALSAAAGLNPNHVSKLAPAAVRTVQANGFTVLENKEGRLLLQSIVSGKTQQFLVADAKLRSGKEVVGFGFIAPAKLATSSIFGKAAEAATSYILICSYVWMNSRWDDLHIHLCAVDAAYITAVLGVVAAAVGALIGIVVGTVCLELCGPIVGVAAATALAITFLGYFWAHSDRDGNVDFVIPNGTMLQPYGGNVLWASTGQWDYMSNECWILEDVWYNQYCG